MECADPAALWILTAACTINFEFTGQDNSLQSGVRPPHSKGTDAGYGHMLGLGDAPALGKRESGKEGEDAVIRVPAKE